jgi:basic amino acid/polyamine antiporter, APA family
MPSAPTSSADTALVRAIGIRTLAAGIVNTTIGAGIFVLPAVVAARIGPAAPLAYLACALTMGLIVTCFAIAGSRVSLTGGLYAYVEVAFGPYVGFLAGVLLWLASLLGVASVASALAASVALAVPAAGAPWGRAAFLATAIGAFAFLNVRGVRVGAGAVEVGTLAKLAPLAVFIACGVFFVRPEALAWPSLPGGGAVSDAALLLIYAFVGTEVALVPSGEVSDPSRTVPRAVFLALATTTALYTLIQIVAQGVLGADLARATDAPLADASARFLGPTGRSLMIAGASISMLGYVGGDMLGSPRMLFAFGRDGFLPAVFARVHSRYRTPSVAIVTHAVVVCALATAGSFAGLLVMANVAVLSLYLLCCAAAWELTRRDVRTGGRPFTVPGGGTVPIAACGAILVILSRATRQEFQAEAAVLGVATILFGLRSLRPRARSAA